MFPRVLRRLLSRWREGPASIELCLYTKAGCPLCVAMKAELARARVHPPFRLVEIDVERDPALLARYGTSVPVLAIAGRAAFKGRLSAAEFERKYARRVAALAVAPRARGTPESEGAGHG
jgi:glutaredoxin